MCSVVLLKCTRVDLKLLITIIVFVCRFKLAALRYARELIMPINQGDMIKDKVLVGLVVTMVTLELVGRRLDLRDWSSRCFATLSRTGLGMTLLMFDSFRVLILFLLLGKYCIGQKCARLDTYIYQREEEKNWHCHGKKMLHKTQHFFWKKERKFPKAQNM